MSAAGSEFEDHLTETGWIVCAFLNLAREIWAANKEPDPCGPSTPASLRHIASKGLASRGVSFSRIGEVWAGV